MKTAQIILAVALTAVLVFVAITLASGGKTPVDLPYLTQNVAEVTVDVSRGWLGDASMEIKGVEVWRGMSLSIGPLWFNISGYLEATALYQGNILESKTKGINIGVNETQTYTFTLGLGQNKSGVLIRSRLIGDGKVIIEKTYTIP